MYVEVGIGLFSLSLLLCKRQTESSCSGICRQDENQQCLCGMCGAHCFCLPQTKAMSTEDYIDDEGNAVGLKRAL